MSEQPLARDIVISVFTNTTVPNPLSLLSVEAPLYQNLYVETQPYRNQGFLCAVADLIILFAALILSAFLAIEEQRNHSTNWTFLMPLLVTVIRAGPLRHRICLKDTIQRHRLCNNKFSHATIVNSILIEAFANCPVQASRNIRNVACHALYSMVCLVLSREAGENIRRPDKE